MILLLSCYAAYFNRIWHYSVCFTLVSEHWKSMHAISYCYISQLLYASPAWWGYLKADERNRLQSVIKKTIRYHYLPRSFSTLDELREDSNEKLFFLSRHNPNHVLHRLLPQPKIVGYNLRERTHNLTLPTDGNAVIKQNFVYIMLFRDIY